MKYNVILFLNLFSLYEGCAITYEDHGSYRKTQTYYSLLPGYGKDECATACSEDPLCAGFGYNTGGSNCFKSLRSDSVEAFTCGGCSFQSKICNLGCTVDYFDHGYYTEPRDKSLILSLIKSTPDACSKLCTLNISCSGFGFDKLTSQCQLSQRSDPQSTLCSSCLFQSKRCTSASFTKPLSISKTTFNATPLTSGSSKFPSTTTKSMTKVDISESIRTKSSIKPPTMTSTIPQIIENYTGITDLKQHFSFHSSVHSTFQHQTTNTKTELFTMQTTSSSSGTKLFTTDVRTSNSLNKSTDINDDSMSSNSTPEQTTEDRNTTTAPTVTPSNSYSHTKTDIETSQTTTKISSFQFSQSTDHIFQNTTTSNLFHSISPTFIQLNFTNTIPTVDSHVTGSNNQESGSPPRIVCLCSCREREFNLDQIILQRKRELKIEIKTLSKTRRKKISVSDPRTSSKAVGFLGILILSLFVSLIVATDLLNILSRVSRIFPMKNPC